MLRTILNVALFAYPAEFRRDYRSQLFLDLEDRTRERGYALRLFFDVLASGIAMRAENLWRDIAYAVRTLSKAPLFTIVAAGTLAIAIAGNAIVFSALEAVLLRPLPYPHVERLALVSAKMQSGGAPGMMTSLPFAFVDHLARRSPIVENAGASLPNDSHVRVNGELIMLHRGFVTRSFFATLGVMPYLGRFFSSNTDANRQTVISYEYWRDHFAGDPHILGKPVKIDEKTYTVVGVTPPGTIDPAIGEREQLWTLMPHEKSKFYGGFPIVRVRPGVTNSALNAELERLWSAARAKDSDTFSNILRVQAKPIVDVLLADARRLWILFGAVAAVLLIACANIANLMLVRAAARSDQFAVRLALGATRRRIAAQTITETLLLCALGCAMGLGIAAACVRPALALFPGHLPRLDTASIDYSVVLYICALGVAVTLVAGMLPAFTAEKRNAMVRRGTRTRTLLIAVEVAATFALLVCSGLFLRSFLTISSQPLGFEPTHAYIATFMLPTAPDVADPNAPPQSAATAMRIAQQVKALPGIEDVAVGTQVPFSTRFYMMGEFHTERQAPSRPGTDHPERMSEFTQVSPNFFNVLRIPLLRGRTFTPRDGTNLILVNEAFAGQFFKGEPALGKRLYSIGGPGTMQIIGIVANTRNTLAQPPKAMAYLPFYGKVPVFQLLIRTTHDNPHLAEAIDRIARAAYPRIGNPPVVSLEDAVREDTANARASFILLAALTLMALILALAGIYGVVAFSTERRHHEIGVRVALGATKRAILRSILASALLQSAIGIAAGLILAAVAANAIDSVLFQTQPLDPVTFVGAALLLLACTALAAAVPAWRAMRVDPAQTLRYE